MPRGPGRSWCSLISRHSGQVRSMATSCSTAGVRSSAPMRRVSCNRRTRICCPLRKASRAAPSGANITSARARSSANGKAGPVPRVTKASTRRNQNASRHDLNAPSACEAIAADQPKRFGAVGLLTDRDGVDRQRRVDEGRHERPKRGKHLVPLRRRQALGQGHVEAKLLHHIGIAPLPQQLMLARIEARRLAFRDIRRR